jgi:LAO/AO transport system kinase
LNQPQSTPQTGTPELAARIAAGDRRALAQAITLAESARPDHQAEAEALLDELGPRTRPGLRVGITGAPGVGKSTFIEALGLHLVSTGARVAVLAVDPSSKRSHGSILGDKTRMSKLSRDERAFIRPSPAGGALGGIARRTREAVVLCEAAGFDTVIVETVGVGQSETAVAGLTDTFVLLIAPGGGGELQGIKRGIVELADLVIVNKNDGSLAPDAGRIAAEYKGALHLLRPALSQWQPPVLLCSALNAVGLDEAWAAVLRHRAALESAGELHNRRGTHALGGMWDEVTSTLLARAREDGRAAALVPELERKVASGALRPAAAARQLLAALDGAPQDGHK